MILRKSGWSFETSSSLGGSIEVGIGVGAAVGSITLKDPRGNIIKFNYVELGGGVGVGGNFSLGGSQEDYLSKGLVYTLPFFRGNELQSQDIEGIFTNIEISAAMGAGGSSSALSLGISTKYYLLHHFTYANFGKAVLFTAGLTQGAMIGASLMKYTGYLWQGNVISDPIILDLISAKASKEEVRMSARSTAQDVAPPIILPGNVLFDFNRFDLLPTAYTTLLNAGGPLISHKGRHIQVQGFADSIGSDAYNVNLSLKRATTIKQWLVSMNFVSESNISVRGFGEAYPVASNDRAEGREKNRRVEIHILQFRS